MSKKMFMDEVRKQHKIMRDAISSGEPGAVVITRLSPIASRQRRCANGQKKTVSMRTRRASGVRTRLEADREQDGDPGRDSRSVYS
jgi:hypothetical protein